MRLEQLEKSSNPKPIHSDARFMSFVYVYEVLFLILSFCFYRIILQVDKSPFVCITCTINICGIFEPNVVSKIHLFTLKWFIVFPFKSNKIIFCIISSDCTINRLSFVYMVRPSFFTLFMAVGFPGFST